MCLSSIRPLNYFLPSKQEKWMVSFRFFFLFFSFLLLSFSSKQTEHNHWDENEQWIGRGKDKELTLKAVVEPFGLLRPDVARPPPRVGIGRRPLQHLSALAPASVLFSSLYRSLSLSLPFSGDDGREKRRGTEEGRKEGGGDEGESVTEKEKPCFCSCMLIKEKSSGGEGRRGIATFGVVCVVAG